MKNDIILSLGLALIFCLLQQCSPVNASDNGVTSLINTPVSTSEKSNPLEGVWLTLASSWDEKSKIFADNVMYKIYAKNRFATIFYKNDQFVGSGGGTYTVEKDHFKEHLEYFSFDSTAVGTTQSFRYEIIGDTLFRQSGTLNTKKYPGSKIDQFMIRKEAGISSMGATNPAVGVWWLESAVWGENQRNKKEIEEIYGEILKIITPNYFYAAYFDKETATAKGFGFGSVKLDGNTYTETLKTFSWDDSAAGQAYDFKVSINKNKLHQVGKIDMDDYPDYVIDEWYVKKQ